MKETVDVIRAFRQCENSVSCDGCPYDSIPLCLGELRKDMASTIESLAAQLKECQAERDKAVEQLDFLHALNRSNVSQSVIDHIRRGLGKDGE